MASIEQTSYNYLERYLGNIRSKGRYSFTLEELQQEFNISYRALKQNLYRLKLKKTIAQVRQGFYVVIPPEYSNQGILPPTMFIDDLMKSLNKPYYISHISAAAMLGAAHQQPMACTVTTETPAPRSIKTHSLSINFYSKKEWPVESIVQKKTNAGYVNVSVPELTALDLLDKSHVFGINRIATIVSELSEEMNSSNLTKIASQFPNNAALQRLGYILENVVGNDNLAESLWIVLNKRKFSTIPLSPKREKRGTSKNRWKVIENMTIESDI